jgi:hypothetical protein
MFGHRTVGIGCGAWAHCIERVSAIFGVEPLGGWRGYANGARPERNVVLRELYVRASIEVCFFSL